MPCIALPATSQPTPLPLLAYLRLQAAIANQAATLAAYEAPDSFVRPGYQAADQVRTVC